MLSSLSCVPIVGIPGMWDCSQGLLEKQREEADVRIDSLEQALSEVRKEYNEVYDRTMTTHIIYVRLES